MCVVFSIINSVELSKFKLKLTVFLIKQLNIKFFLIKIMFELIKLNRFFPTNSLILILFVKLNLYHI